MYRKFAAGFLALLLALGLAACGKDGEDGSDSSAASGPSGAESAPSESAPEDSSQPDDVSAGSVSSSGDSVEEEDSHSVILCNGAGLDAAGLRIREEGSEYWSFEILGGGSWPSGSSIELELSREEWTAGGGWEVEVTFADGNTAVYAVPLWEYGIVELQPDGAFEGE